MILKKFKYKKVSSTNDVAIKKIKQGFKTGIIISEAQTNGRGQYGKKWISRKGNLFLSIFFVINKKIQISRLIVSNLRIIKKILSEYIKSKIVIKKPNDIIVNKKKICGILNETLFYNNLKFLVIGIGINVVSSPDLRNYPTTYLNEISNIKVSRIKLLKRIINAFELKIK
tara:strand:+ start:1754 stop:2266 length:513 start_codon:yes stop_codon:yes gene_type:complete